MFEQKHYRCPACDSEIRQRLSDGEDLDCLSCRNRFRVMLDENTGKAGFVVLSPDHGPEPLHLPKGSIRACATMLLAVSCWVLVFRNEAVPDYLLSLVLTIIGYYFGFRQKVKAAQSRIHEPLTRPREPLFLPPGFIRFFLITGFAAAGFVVYRRGEMTYVRYLEFFIILLGLIAGYLFARLFAGLRPSRALVFVNHLKGAAVLASAVALAWVLLLPGGAAAEGNVPLALAAFVSFYFGSRS